jgi:hypothetical protein
MLLLSNIIISYTYKVLITIGSISEKYVLFSFLINMLRFLFGANNASARNFIINIVNPYVIKTMLSLNAWLEIVYIYT